MDENDKSLRLALKRKWFEMTNSGEKTEDYRDINLFWFKRFVLKPEKPIQFFEIKSDEDVISVCRNSFYSSMIIFNPYDLNIMTLGYPKSSDMDRILKLEHKGVEIRTGNPEWGAEPGKLYFVIKHGKCLK